MKNWTESNTLKGVVAKAALGWGLYFAEQVNWKGALAITLFGVYDVFQRFLTSEAISIPPIINKMINKNPKG